MSDEFLPVARLRFKIISGAKYSGVPQKVRVLKDGGLPAPEMEAFKSDEDEEESGDMASSSVRSPNI